mgnify:CR=1 FL=1
MAAKELQQSDVTIKTGIERPTVSGYTCTSGYGEPATLHSQSALLSAIRGESFGPVNGSNFTNQLLCRTSPYSTTGEVLIPQSLPVTNAEPTLINVHSHVAIPNPNTPFTLQAADITAQAKRVYDDLHLFRLSSPHVYRGTSRIYGLAASGASRPP